MDAAYYEDLAERLYGVLISLDDRIGSDQARLLHHFIEVGEYGLALEEIAGTLAQDAIAITRQERSDMLALAARMNLEGDLVSRVLAACPEVGNREHRPMCSLARVNGGSGTALRKASHAMASASATSVVNTVSATVTRT